MRKKKRPSPFLILLVLGIGLPGFIGILGVQAQAVVNQPELLRAILQLGTSTPTPPPATPLIPTSTVLPLNNFIPSRSLYAFIQAPNGPVSSPYVILTAFSSTPQSASVSIRGFVNSQEFVCSRAPCVISLESGARLVFRAYADSGEASDEVIATVNVTREASGYLVSINLVSQFATFRDSCSLIWGVKDETNATWDSFVQFPYEINTRKTLHTLATQLILNGIVDTSTCSSGGLSLSLDWPTACGLEQASGKMIEWQNQYDEYIWLASREHGIPPKVLKTLIEVESQFWPENSRFYIDEIGLGQINQLGVDVLLRRDPAFYQKVCAGVLSDCSRPYLSLELSQQRLIRGAVASMADATCPSCQYGLDLDKAKDSISLIAMLLKANCEQVDVILDIAARTKPDPDADAATATAVVATATALSEKPPATSYEDLWRFTFAAYHSGLSCFQDAVTATRKARLPMTWENVKKEFECRGGTNYVDGMIVNLYSFDTYLYQPGETGLLGAVPTFIPTRTPIPTPTVFISNAKIKVQVFMDRNANGSPEPEEWIDAMSVLLTTSTNDQITQRTQNGIAVFDMSGYAPGITITVSLPGLYRSESLVLPQQGEVTITFRFEQPPLPTVLP
jgi:hypothetical protein